MKKEVDRFLSAASLPIEKVVSVLGRHVARGLESLWVAKQALAWLDEIEIDGPPANDFEIPKTGAGYGLTEAPRGALGHWLSIENHRIKRYQCIVPTTWNCSPRDDRGQPGAVEQAIAGHDGRESFRSRSKSAASSDRSTPASPVPSISHLRRGVAEGHPHARHRFWAVAANHTHTYQEPTAMTRYTRRDLLRMGTLLAAGAGLGRDHGVLLAGGLEKILAGKAKVLWLQGMSCTGCSVSFLNAEEPGPLEILTEIISLVYHPNLSAAQGETVMEVIDKLTAQGGYFLVFEGSMPVGMPEACVLGGKPLTAILPEVLKNAAAVVAAGTCTAFGGIPAAEGNATGAVGVREFMQQQGIAGRGASGQLPGLSGASAVALGHARLRVGQGRPQTRSGTADARHVLRELGARRMPAVPSMGEAEFAEKFGDEGCLFKLGCLGPLSHTNCPRQQWNGGVNWCIRAGAPCIACTNDDFAKRRDFPFYRKGEAVHSVAYREDDRRGTQS